jgi:LysM repeat protein
MKKGRLPIETVQYVVGVGAYKTLLSYEEPSIRAEASKLILHTVTATDDWGRISESTGVPVLELRLYNPYLAMRPLRPGSLIAYPLHSEGPLLLVPRAGARGQPASAGGSAATEPPYYLTRRGDNYLMLAFAFDVDLEQFRGDNDLWRVQVPYERMHLAVNPRPDSAAADAILTLGGGRVAVAGLSSGGSTVDLAPGTSSDAAVGGATAGVRHHTTTAADYKPVPAATAPAGAETTEAPAARARTIVHKVRRGETLYGIASHYGVTVTLIQTTNDLSQAKLKVGQLLKIPSH